MSISLSSLKPAAGSRHRTKRLGCGVGSGHGGQCTRGMKGQRSRRGDGKMVGFEGGQVPLLRRIPKRGFRNTAFRKEYEVVNLSLLDEFFESNHVINPQALKELGFVKKDLPIKILGEGLTKKVFKVSACAFSKSAEKKIKAAGGTIEIA